VYKQLISLTLVRAWVAFVIIGVLAGIAVLALDGDDPLRSDDPYVAGFACGVFAAVMALVFTVAERVCKSRWSASAWYFALLGLWCLFLFWCAWEFAGTEGAKAYPYVAGGSVIIGVISWPLFFWRRLPLAVVLAASLIGLIAFAMFAIVVVRRAAPHL
jgi:hypothetical protein